MTEQEKIGIELLLSEPEIVEWLEPDEGKDDDGSPEQGSRRHQPGLRFSRNPRRPS